MSDDLPFWGHIRANLGPGWARPQKNPQKSGILRTENGGKWRSCEGQSAIFAEHGAAGPGSEAAELPKLYVCRPHLPPSAWDPPNRQPSAILSTPGQNGGWTTDL
jgi:hypothetical protein